MDWPAAVTPSPKFQANFHKQRLSVVRKMRAGMMPPAGMKRPEAATLESFATALEAHMDAAAASKPNPGSRPFQRLNRAEYEASIESLLGLDVDAGAYLPLDTKSENFDNIADVLGVSPALIEGYVAAATRIRTSPGETG